MGDRIRAKRLIGLARNPQWAGGGDEAITALKASAQRIQRATAQILDLLGADGAGQGPETAVAA